MRTDLDLSRPKSPGQLPTSKDSPSGPYLFLVQGQYLPVVLLKFQARDGDWEGLERKRTAYGSRGLQSGQQKLNKEIKAAEVV